MRTNNNTTTTGLPYGMSNVTNLDWIQAAQFLYAQYPGIYKLRIKRVCRGSKAVQIRVIVQGLQLSQRHGKPPAGHQARQRPEPPPHPSGTLSAAGLQNRCKYFDFRINKLLKICIL